MSPTELKARRDAGTGPRVLDVREGWELDVARIPDVLHIPMNEIPGRLIELPREEELLVMCRSGGRSMQVAQFLARNGFNQVARILRGASWPGPAMSIRRCGRTEIRHAFAAWLPVTLLGPAMTVIVIYNTALIRLRL